MDQNRLVKKIVETGTTGKRRKGRPRKSWIQRIDELARQRGKTRTEIRLQAMDRKGWKKWVFETEKLQSDTPRV